MRKTVSKVSMIRILAVVMFICLFLQSCATYKYTTVSKSGTITYANMLQGKSLGIVPFKVNFFNSHMMEIEYVKIGDIYTKRYAYEGEETLTQAEFGALCLNIFGKTKVNKTAVQAEFMNDFVAFLKGEQDYTVNFFKGLGESGMGALSNRPIDYDRTVNPPKVFFTGEAPEPYFSEIKLLGENDTPTTDLVLNGEIAIDNEIQQYLSAPFNSSGEAPADGHYPEKDDYYVCTRISIYFAVIDPKTGKTLVSDKTKLDWPITLTGAYNKTYLPIEDQKAFYDLDKFAALNYDEYALAAVRGTAKYILPYLTPFFVNTTHAEKVEKEK